MMASNDRYQKRKQSAELAAIVRKAKTDMQKWMYDLSDVPSEKEIKAFQAGYIAGINRGSSVK
jgi:hypothetical protein